MSPKRKRVTNNNHQIELPSAKTVAYANENRLDEKGKEEDVKEKLTEKHIQYLQTEEIKLQPIQQSLKFFAPEITNIYKEKHLLLSLSYTLAKNKRITIGLSPVQKFEAVVKLTASSKNNEGIAFRQSEWEALLGAQEIVEKYFRNEIGSELGYISLGDFGLHFGGAFGERAVTITWTNLYSCTLNRAEFAAIFKINDILAQYWCFLRVLSFYNFYFNILSLVLQDLKEINDSAYLKSDFLNCAIKHMDNYPFFETENTFDCTLTFNKMIFLELLYGRDEEEKTMFDDFSQLWVSSKQEETKDT